MPSLPSVNHKRAVNAFRKAGFWITRQEKHITMTNGERIITIPRANPVNSFTKDLSGNGNDAKLNGGTKAGNGGLVFDCKDGYVGGPALQIRTGALSKEEIATIAKEEAAVSSFDKLANTWGKIKD